MRKINVRFFLFLVISITILSGAIFGLHRLQAGNIAEALRWQASQAEKDGKLDRAAKYLGRYLEFAREDLDEREHLGMVLSERAMATSPQRRARARFVLEQVLAKDPQRHGARERLCEILIAGRMFEPAKEHLVYLEKNQPSSADSTYLYGLWHEAQVQTVPALEAYRRAIKLDDSKIDAHVRAVALMKKLDFGKEARHAAEIEHLVKAVLQKAPNDPGVLSLAAEYSQERGDTAMALQYLEGGLKQNPHEPRLYLSLANLHSQAGKRADAMDLLKTGLTKVRKDRQYELRWALANVLIDDNRLDDSAKILQEIREVNPLSADFLDARCEMQRGRWFEAAKLFERIRPNLKGVNELALQVDLYLGACYEQMDEPALQLIAFTRATEIDTTSLAARRGLAGARWALGQTAEALAIYQDLVLRTRDADEAARRRIEYVRLLLQDAAQRKPKDWTRIEGELTQIEKTLVKSLDAALLRAEFVHLQGDKDKARVLLERAAADHPDRFEPWIALVALAASKNDTKLAPQLMQTAEKRFRDKAEFRLAQIRHATQNSGPDSEAMLQRAEQGVESFTPREQSALWQALAEAHYDAHRHVDSTRALEQRKKLSIHAQDIRVRLQLLELALLQDDDARAQTVLNEIKRLEGDSGADWNLGEALRLIRLARKGQAESLDKARHLLTVAAASRPNWHPIVQARAELDELQGRPDQAIANYRRAIELGSRDPVAMKQLIALLSQAHRFEEVEQVLARMHKQLGSTDEVARYHVANSYQKRDFKKAEHLMKQIVASNSTNYRDHLWMGQILAASGQPAAEAEKCFRRALALAPKQPEAWMNLVRHLVASGQLDAVRSELANARKALPDDRRDLTLGQCYELMGSPKEAADSYKAAVEKQPRSAVALRTMADFCLRLGQLGDAERLCRQLLELASNDSERAAARRGLALALAKQNRPNKTVEALQLVGLALDDKGQLVEGKHAESIDDQLLQARVLGSIQHHKLRSRAVTLLESVQVKSALGTDDQYLLARLYAQQGLDSTSWMKARNHLKDVTLEHPKNARYLAFSAQLHLQQKEYAEAESLIARLEAVERERKTPAGGLGSIELRAKMFEMRGFGSQAVALLTGYAEQSGALPARKLLLAGLHARLGNYREAIDLCEAVRQTGSYYFEANHVAVDLLRQNRPSEAQPTKHQEWLDQRRRVETALRTGLEKDPKDIPLRMNLADLMELEGKYTEVETLCRDVLKQNPEHLVALNNLAWLLGQKSNTAAEALTLIERAIGKYGPRPELVDTRAIIQLNLGQTDAAVRDLERVVNEAPTPTRLFHLSRAYEKARNSTSALAMLRRANETGLTVQQLHPAEQAEYQRVTALLMQRP